MHKVSIFNPLCEKTQNKYFYMKVCLVTPHSIDSGKESSYMKETGRRHHWGVRPHQRLQRPEPVVRWKVGMTNSLWQTWNEKLTFIIWCLCCTTYQFVHFHTYVQSSLSLRPPPNSDHLSIMATILRSQFDLLQH